MSTAGKPARSEAAQLIDRLQLGGMSRAEIARQLGTTTAVLKNIGRGHTSGDNQLNALRSLTRFAPRAASSAPGVPAAAGSTHDSNRDAALASDATASDGARQAAIPTLDTVDAPLDERSGAQRFRDAMKDALLGRAHDSARADLATVTHRGGSTGAGANETLTEQLVPILALVAVIVSQIGIPSAYSAVGPTHDEASAILRPLVRAMTRQLEIAGQLTETQLDVLAALAAAGLYADRAWNTYRALRATESRTVDATPRRDAGARRADAGTGRDTTPAPAHVAPSSPGADALFFGGSTGTSAGFGGSQAGSEAQFTIAAQPAPQSARQHGSGDGGNGHAAGTDPFASVYAADAIGRRMLGIN